MTTRKLVALKPPKRRKKVAKSAPTEKTSQEKPVVKKVSKKKEDKPQTWKTRSNILLLKDGQMEALVDHLSATEEEMSSAVKEVYNLMRSRT